jgi:tetratricopeptide (TPR) repeat protein
MPGIHDIEALLESEPDDVFLNFGRAMALVSAGRHEDALRGFERTIGLDRNYVPAHFQRGRLLASLGREKEAREGLEEGIRVARAVGDRHAAGEMEEFIEAL